jgi:hypothetical protein
LQNNWRKNWRFAQITARVCKTLIKKLIFDKTPIFAEKWPKSQKIMIITSTPGLGTTDLEEMR